MIDSIQTTFSEKLDMAPGSIGQVREVASQLLFWTKKNHVPGFLIGHITKDGAIAGPKALEHIVDTVLYFEGPRQHPHRIVRTIKNRFGPANELGNFRNGMSPDCARWKNLQRFSFQIRNRWGQVRSLCVAWKVRGRCLWKSRLWFRVLTLVRRDVLQQESILSAWPWFPQFWKSEWGSTSGIRIFI